jgi:hypothetical protein
MPCSNISVVIFIKSKAKFGFYAAAILLLYTPQK